MWCFLQEIDYKRELKQYSNIDFNKLFTITNMPIKRFADFLHNNGQYKQYMELLVNSFNKATVDHLMCVDQGTYLVNPVTLRD